MSMRLFSKTLKVSPLSELTEVMTHEFDQYAGSYQEELNSSLAISGQSHDFFVQDKIRHLGRLFSSATPDSSSLNVLDVGCGVGLGHPQVADLVQSLHGVDVSSESIRVAQESHASISYQAYDGQHLPFENDTFDAAYTICVMHHVPPTQWRDFLVEMHRVIKPGGQVIVIEHNPFNPATQWIVRNNELDKDAVLLNPFRLKTLFSECELEWRETRFTLFTPFGHPLFRLLDEMLWWLPLGAQYVMEARKS